MGGAGPPRRNRRLCPVADQKAAGMDAAVPGHRRMHAALAGWQDSCRPLGRQADCLRTARDGAVAYVCLFQGWINSPLPRLGRGRPPDFWQFFWQVFDSFLAETLLININNVC